MIYQYEQNAVTDFALIQLSFFLFFNFCVFLTDYFGTIWPARSLIRDSSFIAIFIADQLVLVFVLLSCIFIKVEINDNYDEILLKLDEMIRIISHVANNIYDLCNNYKIEDLFTERRNQFGREKPDYGEQIYLIVMYQIKRHTEMKIKIENPQEIIDF